MVILWCGNFIALKICLEHLSPFGVTTFRVVASALILFLVCVLRGNRHDRRELGRQDVLYFFKLAFIGLFLNQTLFVIGLSHTTVSHSAIIVTFGPVFTLLFAWMKSQERLTAKAIVGMALSVSGVVLLNLDKDFTFQTRYLLGDILTLGGSVAFAYYTVISKHAASAYGAVYSTAFTYFAGAILFLPLGLPLILRLDWRNLPWAGLTAFFYVAALSSVVAQLIFYYSLRHISSSRLASLAYLQPVITTIASVVLLSERPSLNFLLGGSAVVGGVVFTHRRAGSQ
jgi:drug/metabolite transporter (DMT)-like permease